MCRTHFSRPSKPDMQPLLRAPSRSRLLSDDQPCHTQVKATGIQGEKDDVICTSPLIAFPIAALF